MSEFTEKTIKKSFKSVDEGIEFLQNYILDSYNNNECTKEEFFEAMSYLEEMEDNMKEYSNGKPFTMTLTDPIKTSKS